MILHPVLPGDKKRRRAGAWAVAVSLTCHARHTDDAGTL